jgi:hypothetical protein
MKEYRKKTLGVTKKSSLRAALVTAALIAAVPATVYAATDGEIFQRLWGNSGRQTVESHEEIVIDDAKVDEDGNPSERVDTYPKVEYVEADPVKAEELIGENISTEPVSVTVNGTTITVNSITHDGIGIVVDYTIEKEGGVDILNYSQLDNEAKGAWLNENQTFRYDFYGGAGKTYVNLEKSTPDKLYCTDYITDASMWNAVGAENTDNTDTGLVLSLVEYEKSMTALYEENPDVDIDCFIKDEKSVTIPFSKKIETSTFTNSDGGSIEISPIAMRLNNCTGLLEEELDEGCECVDFITNIEITYKDGSTYLVENRIDPSDPDADTEETEVASYAYTCGAGEQLYTLFNRLVDVENIEKITINNTDYTLN